MADFLKKNEKMEDFLKKNEKMGFLEKMGLIRLGATRD